MGNANPYKDFLGSVVWHIRRFGIVGVVSGILRRIFAPIIIWTLDKDYFEFKGKPVEYLYHRYNPTWKNERCIEVPLVKSIVDSEKGDILEIGNVLPHYYKNVRWDVLDKFEKGDKIINDDIVSFKPEKKYDVIISVSTFEHIGLDDELTGFKSSAEKIEKSFKNTLNALKKKGKIVITAPVGYNPDMDKLILSNKLKFDEQYFYKKISSKKWVQVKMEIAAGTRYNYPYQYGNCIFVGIKKKK